MKRNYLSVIKGGLNHFHEAEKSFSHAYATKSRLMGSVWLFICWDVVNCPDAKKLFQYYYIDFEENGIEDFHSLLDPKDADINLMEQTTVNCMGSSRVSLNLDEALLLISYGMKINSKRNKPMPQNAREFSFVLSMMKMLQSDDVHTHINMQKKLCEKVTKDFAIINYTLMRICGQDTDIVQNFSSEEGIISDDFIFADDIPSTFFKNDISQLRDDGNMLLYEAKSLIQHRGKFYMMLSHIFIKNKLIHNMELKSLMEVSEEEAGFVTSKEEFTLVYKLNSEFVPLNDLILASKLPLTTSTYENCYLFMAFKPTNDHVKEKNFRLQSDIYGFYIISFTNEIIIVSQSLEHVNILRSNLLNTHFESDLQEVKGYHFHTPLASTFIDSDYYDFIEFIKDAHLYD